MYIAVLFVHSWLRWIVLALGAWLLAASIAGAARKRDWSAQLERLHASFLGLLDLQFLLGIALYFVLSPIAAAARSNFAVAMKEPTLRFFGVEHIATMLIAVVVAHLGRVRSKRKQGPARLRSAAITTAVWLLCTLAAIPWPGLDIARPLFRTQF
jgi:hypothetical protein